MSTAMTEGFSRLVAQAVRAGFVLPEAGSLEAGHGARARKDTIGDVPLSRPRSEYAFDANAVAALGHEATQDTLSGKGRHQHPNGANEPQRAQFCALVKHLDHAPGLPTHPATCVWCDQSDWLVTLRTGDGRTFHVSCWRTASAPDHNGG